MGTFYYPAIFCISLKTERDHHLKSIKNGESIWFECSFYDFSLTIFEVGVRNQFMIGGILVTVSFCTIQKLMPIHLSSIWKLECGLLIFIYRETCDEDYSQSLDLYDKESHCPLAAVITFTQMLYELWQQLVVLFNFLWDMVF